ncbi:hypothetical protein DPC56_07040 [Methanothermobacter tenebrarum]|uniref:Uncharacterized protein n=1 Tax=Methanothermobacter tenebrarum TaxID=680118 RepID=A0A328P964_9EURY|nr:hypothetical protein DPC56_07040 [Methanothermobacter tenebrarum]
MLLVVFLSVYIYASFSGPVAQDDVINETLPLALEYNKTKEYDTRDIPIKGKIICCPLSFPDFEDFIYEPPI